MQEFFILFIYLVIFCQPGLRSIWEKYYEEAHAVVYVIDPSCPSCFEDSKSALGELFVVILILWNIVLF